MSRTNDNMHMHDLIDTLMLQDIDCLKTSQHTCLPRTQTLSIILTMVIKLTFNNNIRTMSCRQRTCVLVQSRARRENVLQRKTS